MEIYKRKYNLTYPEALGVDMINQMLYWTEKRVIHTSDYYGRFHKTVKKNDFYDPNFPGCYTFADDSIEHNFFIENRQLQHFNRDFVPNHLLSISYHKYGEVSITS